MAMKIARVLTRSQLIAGLVNATAELAGGLRVNLRREFAMLKSLQSVRPMDFEDVILDRTYSRTKPNSRSTRPSSGLRRIHTGIIANIWQR